MKVKNADPMIRKKQDARNKTVTDMERSFINIFFNIS